MTKLDEAAWSQLINALEKIGWCIAVPDVGDEGLVAGALIGNEDWINQMVDELGEKFDQSAEPEVLQ